LFDLQQSVNIITVKIARENPARTKKKHRVAAGAGDGGSIPPKLFILLFRKS
jgi:hypothetical protein